MKTSTGQPTNRRLFVKSCAGIGAMLGFPTIIPAAVLGRNGAVSPSNRIAMGFIGCGGRMSAVMNGFLALKEVQPVAVCDVLAANRDAKCRQAKIGPDAAYGDFRQLLARGDIDAVAIATPDHWHVPVSIAAAEAGKDVYCEKPLSNTIAEGRALVRVIQQYGTVFQHGTQLHSEDGTRRACELVLNGRIGQLKEIRIGSPPGLATDNAVEMPLPAGFDYDMWLGPAPYQPFTHDRVFPVNRLPGWYFVSDYSKAGWIAGYGVHDLDIAQMGMGLGTGGPIAIEGRGIYPADGLFDTVLTYELEFRYANGVKIHMTDTSKNRHGVTFIGDKGTVFTRGGIEATPTSLLKDTMGPKDIHLERSPGHPQNFIDCVKTRAKTVTHEEIAHRATSTALLGGIACKLARPLSWDPLRERFSDDPEADRLLYTSARSPWQMHGLR